MVYALSVLLAVIGLMGLASTRSFLGFIVATQILFFGFTSLFAFIAYGTQTYERGVVFGLFVLVAGLALQVLSYALGTRMYHSSGRVDMSHLKRIKH